MSASAEKTIQFPTILEETLQRRQGVILMVGLRDSGADETMRLLLKRLQGKSTKVISDPGADLPESADVILLEGEFSAERLHRALNWAEEGRLVVINQKAPSSVTALRRLLSFDFGEGRRHMVWRLCDQMLLMAGQMRIKAEGEAPVDIFEILLMTPHLRSALEEEDFQAVEDSLKAGDENSGSVSFNQSLLQLLLRRRIDIKTAFEVTRDPVHLDQVLKKVGI